VLPRPPSWILEREGAGESGSRKGEEERRRGKKGKEREGEGRNLWEESVL